MTAKINIRGIVKKHIRYATRNDDGSRLVVADILTFYGLPIVASLILGFLVQDVGKELPQAYITVCAIFAGLLLNLLVLVYDQSKQASEEVRIADAGRKELSPHRSLEELIEDAGAGTDHIGPTYNVLAIRKMVLDQLVVNISYSIIVALVAIALCVVAIIGFDFKPAFEVRRFELSLNFDVFRVLISLATFLVVNLFLTMLMIVKRIYRLMEE